MREESSHREDTTENTYTDPGADTPEGYQIASTSRSLARAVIGDATLEDRIRQRCAISVGDFVMADLLSFCGDPVSAGREAVARQASIITDIRMVKAGILRSGHQCNIVCALDYGKDIAESKGITRTSSGFYALRERLGGSIIVIGNAPSALLTVCECIMDGSRPAMVIAMPVGFVNAAESKKRLRKLDVPSITTRGTRGGTPPAVAAMNEIITMHLEQNRIEGA